MNRQKGAVLLNLVLWITLFSLLLTVLTSLLASHHQQNSGFFSANQAYYLAVSGSSQVDGNPCALLLPVTWQLTDGGQVTILPRQEEGQQDIRIIRVEGRVSDQPTDSVRWLEKRFSCTNGLATPLSPWLEGGE